jgi:hypothetical protein
MEGIVPLPALGLVWLAILALRGAGIIKPSSRRSFVKRPGFWVVIVRFLAISVAYAWVELQSAWVQMLVLLPVAAACAPGLVIEYIVIPLGLPKLAFWMTTYLRPLGVGGDPRSTAVCHAARALLCKTQPNPNHLVWLEDEISWAHRGRGAMLVAEGFLAVLRGDLRTARVELRAADALHRSFISRSLRAAARDWLIADAAAAGNWREVRMRGTRGTPLFRWSYAVGRIAQRLTGNADAPSKLTAVLLWAIAPRRRATWPLLRRALRAARFSAPPEQRVGVVPTLPFALGQLASLHRGPASASNARVAETVRALQDALDAPATLAFVERRVLALGATRQAQSLLGEFREQLETMLGGLVGEGAPPRLHGAPPELLLAAARKARGRLLRDLEMYCSDYEQRTRAAVTLTELEEWRTWAKVRDSGERLLAIDPDAEAALFQVAYVALCNFAVFQHNQHLRTGLAHNMYDWLHQRAQSLNSPKESALLAKNMKAALS